MNNTNLAVVVIGRNEGDRLPACLESILTSDRMPVHELIYVDSNSTDGSPERAARLGANVVVLGGGKLSAARARNAGWRASTAPFVLFLDGDTILDREFVGRALPEFENLYIAAVCGNRREIRPNFSLYNRILDLDWIYPSGKTEYCGGDALMRRSCLEEANGFDPDLIAGEEPDLCRRMRGMGYSILHLDIPMTGHDLAMWGVKQYWRRAVRTGHAYAEVADRYRKTADPLWGQESGRNLRRGSVYLVAAIGVGVATVILRSPLPLLAGALALAAMTVRTAYTWRWKCRSRNTLLLFGLHSHLQQVPILQGQVLYLWGKWRKQSSTIIEYKPEQR